MSLARGEAVIDLPTVMIAIAPSMEERVRLAALGLPLLLVSSRAEALAFLRAMEVPGVEPTVLASVPAPALGLVIDSDWRVATWRDKSVPLSPLEHDLLSCLLEEVGRTWTFACLHREVWGNDHLGGRADLQSVVKRLRRKLGELGSPLQIQAVRGVGLRLTDRRGGAERLSLPLPRRSPA